MEEIVDCRFGMGDVKGGMEHRAWSIELKTKKLLTAYCLPFTAET
jgi:hypothetical protein